MLHTHGILQFIFASPSWWHGAAQRGAARRGAAQRGVLRCVAARCGVAWHGVAGTYARLRTSCVLASV
eukprot:8984104-Alexandrium_andersonii.AAC.1